MLVWDRDKSVTGDQPEAQEETSTSVGGLGGRQRRSSRDRRAPAVDAKLKKKLATLEELETKTEFTKPKQTRTRKK